MIYARRLTEKFASDEVSKLMMSDNKRATAGVVIPADVVWNLLWAVSIFLLYALPLAMPLNLLLGAIGLVAWKQVALTAHLVLSVLSISRVGRRFVDYEWTFKVYWTLGFLWVTSALLAFLEGVPLTRVIYSAYYYLGAAGFVATSLLAAHYGKQRKLLIHIFIVAAICGVGLLVDFKTNVFSVFGESSDPSAIADWADKRELGFRRAQFLFETSSNCFAFLSLGLVIGYWRFLCVQKQLVAQVLGVGMAAISAGLIVTQTRAQWAGLVLLWSLISLIALAYERRRRTKIVVTLILISVGLYFGVLMSLRSDDRDLVLERFALFLSSEEKSNNVRFEQWADGAELLLDWKNWLHGTGVGSTAGQISVPGVLAAPHYESSFFSAFGEAGVLGLALRYLPVLLVFRNYWSGQKRTIFATLCAAWAATWFVVTAVAPTAGSYHGLMALFLVLGMSRRA